MPAIDLLGDQAMVGVSLAELHDHVLTIAEINKLQVC